MCLLVSYFPRDTSCSAETGLVLLGPRGFVLPYLYERTE